MDNDFIPEIKIQTKGTKTHVFIDGKEIKGITRLELSHDANGDTDYPTLRMDIVATNLTLDATMIPELPKPFRAWYLPAQKLIDAGKITKDEAKLFKEGKI